MATTALPAPHWSLALYLDYLRRAHAPGAPFDPEGVWENAYDVFPIYGALDVTGKAWSERHKGTLRIKRKPDGSDQGVELEVFSEVTFLDLGTLPTKYQRTSAAIVCRNDSLATLIRWELRTAAIGKEDGRPLPLSEMQESGRALRGRADLLLGTRSRSLAVGEPVTSNWSLFDAVQRLPGRACPSFTMLEDLRLVRREQRLVPEAPVEVEFADGATRLWGFRQTGEGILPVHWWRDKSGRVLLVLGSVRAYIWHGEEA